MPDASNPYGPPHQPSNSTASLAPSNLRLLAFAARRMAMLLAVGATLWAVICVLPLLASGWRGLFVFGPGYILTFGYYWRAIARPSLMLCRVIWGFSLLIQGAWMAWMAILVGNWHGFGEDAFAVVIAAWWVTSTAISLAGLLFDPGEEAVDNPGY